MSYKDKGEATREYYRRQGEERERERIIKLLDTASLSFADKEELLALINRSELVVK